MSLRAERRDASDAVVHMFTGKLLRAERLFGGWEVLKTRQSHALITCQMLHFQIINEGHSDYLECLIRYKNISIAYVRKTDITVWMVLCTLDARGHIRLLEGCLQTSGWFKKQSQSMLMQLHVLVVQTFQQATCNRSKCWHCLWLGEKKLLHLEKTKSWSILLMLLLNIMVLPWLFGNSQSRYWSIVNLQVFKIKTTLRRNWTFSYLCNLKQPFTFQSWSTNIYNLACSTTVWAGTARLSTITLCCRIEMVCYKSQYFFIFLKKSLVQLPVTILNTDMSVICENITIQVRIKLCTVM